MTDILDLPGWAAVPDPPTKDGRLVIEAEYAKQPDSCRQCGVIGALYKHGIRPITFMDSPVRGKPTRLKAKVQRYKCRECSGTFLQPLAGVDVERRMTTRCLEYIQEQCLRDTFQRVSEHLGCDEKTVRNVASDYIDGQHKGYKPYLPEWIGLDETHLNKVMRAIVTDVGQKRPVDLLPDRDKGTLTRWFSQFKSRGHVKALTIDMRGPYRDVAAVMLPGVPVVIDKFHVIKKANESLERTRIRLGKTKTAGVRRGWMRSKALVRMRYRDLSEKQRFHLDMWLANEPESSLISSDIVHESGGRNHGRRINQMSEPESAEEARIAKAFDEMFIAAKAKKADLMAGDPSVARELGRIAATHGFSRDECMEYCVRVVQMVLDSPTRH